MLSNPLRIILLNVMNENLLIVNGDHIKVNKPLIKGAHFTLPSIIGNNRLKE